MAVGAGAEMRQSLGTTVIAHDPVAMGREAASLAVRRIHGDPSPAQTVIIPTTLVPRGSGERPPRDVHLQVLG